MQLKIVIAYVLLISLLAVNYALTDAIGAVSGVIAEAMDSDDD